MWTFYCSNETSGFLDCCSTLLVKVKLTRLVVFAVAHLLGSSWDSHHSGRVQDHSDATAWPLLSVSLVSTSQILDEIAEQGIKIYQLPDADSDEDEEFKEQTRVLKVREGHSANAIFSHRRSAISLCWFSILFPFIFASLHWNCSSLIPLFSTYSFLCLLVSTNIWLPFPGKHSLCCHWLQPAYRSEGEEDPWSSVPLGCSRGGESWAQWLPEVAHHACVSIFGYNLKSKVL